MINVFGQDALVILSMAVLSTAASDFQMLSCLEEWTDPIAGSRHRSVKAAKLSPVEVKTRQCCWERCALEAFPCFPMEVAPRSVTSVQLSHCVSGEQFSLVQGSLVCIAAS